jgi:rhodanese-related sulfurtransferase
MSHITVTELAFWVEHGFSFDLLDVRRARARTQDGNEIATSTAISTWRDPAAWLDWKDEWLGSPRPVVLYCAHGHEISQGLTAALRAMGIDARHLVGGIERWRAEGLPVVGLAPAVAVAVPGDGPQPGG